MSSNGFKRMLLLAALAAPLFAAPGLAGAIKPASPAIQESGHVLPVHGCHADTQMGPARGGFAWHRHHVGRDCRTDMSGRDDRRDGRDGRRGDDRDDRRDGRRGDDRDGRDGRRGDRGRMVCHGDVLRHRHDGYGNIHHRHSRRDCRVRVLRQHRGERPRGRDCVRIGVLTFCE